MGHARVELARVAVVARKLTTGSCASLSGWHAGRKCGRMNLGRRASYLLAWCVGCAAQDGPAIVDDAERDDVSGEEWQSAEHAVPVPDDPCAATFEIGPDFDAISIPAECAHMLEVGDPDPTHDGGSPEAPVADFEPAAESASAVDE